MAVDEPSELAFAQEVRDRFSPFYPAGWPADVDDSCEIGLLYPSTDVAMGTIFVSFGHFSPERSLFLSCSDSSRSTCL